MALLTLVADVATSAPDPEPLPGPYESRTVRHADIEEIGRLYFAAYETGVACATEEEAVADIRASFDGEYGPLWGGASPVATVDDVIVGVVLTVHEAPWDDAPDGPFIIEMFTAVAHRHRGVGRGLLATVLAEVRASGAATVALRVRTENTPARRLYRALGFRPRRSDG